MTAAKVAPEHKPRTNAERLAAVDVAEVLAAKFGPASAARIAFAAWKHSQGLRLREMLAELGTDIDEVTA